MGIKEEVVGSITMGSGIAAMHYTGMAAMRAQAEIRYDLRIVVLSIVVAIVTSLAALILAFKTRDEKYTSRKKVMGAAVMGSTICLMHYTGMAAVCFSRSEKKIDISQAIGVSPLRVVVISFVILLVLSLATIAAFLDRLLAAKKLLVDISRESESRYLTLAEAIPQIIWTSDAHGNRTYVNRQWYDYSGFDLEQTSNGGWESALHAADLSSCQKNWAHSIQSGGIFEMEYRIRRASDGIYRWHLARALPVRDSSGNVVSWFGTCTDIDDQKLHQHRLQEQIKIRTAEVLAMNAHLKREMAEREHAQAELNKQNAAMVCSLTKQTARAILLARMSKLLQSCTNMEEVFSIVQGLAPKIFPDFRGALIVLNPSRNLLETAGSWSDCELPDSTTFEVSSCWGFRTGQRHLVEGGDTTAQCGHVVAADVSYLCIPMIAQAGAVGVLHLQRKRYAKEPDESELLLVSSLAEQVGISILHLKLQEALRQQSTRDVLTGLYNRRHLEESLERELRRATRGDKPVGVVMFDLDHFKAFNDTFGHEAGDSVLRELGSLLSRNVRAEDIHCRFGGEEFVLILPSATLEGAKSRADRLRTEVSQLAVMHLGKSLGAISISVGVAAFPIHGSSVKELMAAADRALYKAKKEGRDRVVVAEVTESAEVAKSASAGESS
jgi:diguanylate cyclase (GGDEF)-like protein/PAS domain S-box-containing protein